MKHISVLVPKGLAIVDTIIGSVNLFQMANSYYRKKGMANEDLFSIDLVGMEKEPHTYNKFFSVTPNRTILEVSKTDLIIVPGLVGNMQEQIDLNQPFVSWMKQHRIQHNVEIASLCRGQARPVG